MDNRIYGYARVSTREQNEDRQIEALKRFGVPEQQIIMDKASGKDTEREGYLYLKRQILRRGDTLVIKELDRLSRNKSDIKRELEHFKERENVHPLLDVLLASAFEWQREHQSKSLVIALDEIKRQSFFDGSPLHTIITQGRKFSIKLIGMTQEYVSRDSHAVDIMKEAGIQIFFQPANAKDKVAAELGYRDAQQACLGSLGIGEFIVKADLYNKLDEVNEPAVIACKTLKFEDSPLFDKYMKTNGEQVWVPFEKKESASGTQKSG